MTGNLRTHFSTVCLALLALCSAGGMASAQNVVVHLKDGDQISGLILSENTNQVVISNAWVKALLIPLSDIAKREVKIVATAPAPSPVAAAKPPPAAPPSWAKVASAAKSAVLHPVKPKGTWHGEIRLGADTIISTKNQQDYTGHLKLTYARPYVSYPKEFFRNTTELDAEYQKTDGQESANHAYGSNKSDFDLGKKTYGYGLFGAGYDDVQKIDFRYQVGPGVGSHVIQDKSFVFDVEGGLDYEAQYRRNISSLRTFYSRLAEDFTWNILESHKLTLTENLAFYPDLEHAGEYRNDFISTLSYGFWKNFSLGLTLLDHYNTELAPGVDNNQFEVRSSLGFTF